MRTLVEFLLWPPLHVVVCMSPMAYIVLGRRLHLVMTDRFRLLALRLSPVVLILAAYASVTHPLRIAMGAALLSPYLQWGAVYALYRRFQRLNSRPPLAVDETNGNHYALEDRLFNISVSLLVTGLPAAIVLALVWIQFTGLTK